MDYRRMHEGKRRETRDATKIGDPQTKNLFASFVYFVVKNLASLSLFDKALDKVALGFLIPSR
jgi:hypothetical protein